MIDEDKKPAGNDTPAPEAPTVKPRRTRKRALKIDKEKIVAHVLDTLQHDLDARQERINKHMELEEMRHGWMPDKDWPWSDCANFWVPIILISEFRMRATLESAVKSTRPVVESRAQQKRNQPKQQNIDRLLDYQYFVENQGEKKADDLICNFVQDDAAFIYCPWVRENQTVREIRILPGLDPSFDHIPQILPIPGVDKGVLGTIFPGFINAAMKDKDGWDWEVDYQDDEGKPARALVEIYETEDGKIEACVTKTIRTFDGPAPQVLDFEDVVFPPRAANLQPQTQANPHGAPWVRLLCKTNLNMVKRRMQDGFYDQLTEEDLEDIKKGRSSTGSGSTDEEPKENKDAIGGDNAGFHSGDLEDRQYVVSYDRWDINGDGYDEDVIFWVFRDSKKLAAVRYLSELYPGTPVMRPIESESFFPIANRVYGRSFGSVLIAIQKMMQASMNQHFDWGTITNVPFFTYRASSGMKQEQIHIEPGVGYPLDNPQQDINFPQFATRGETFNINTMSLLQQFAERIGMLSDASFGRVPTGKSSAMRNVGTVTALLSQGDARSEQVLRRLFHLFARQFQFMHRLNRRYLPEQKEIRILGQPKVGEDPYTVITAESQNADVDFEFRATMMNTNKQMVSQSLMQTAGLIMAPLAIQAGIVTAEQVYNLLTDITKSQDLDHERYLKLPPGIPSGPRLTAEEAFSAIVAGEPPVGAPLEPAMEHLQKFMGFTQAPPETAELVAAFGPDRQMMFQNWVNQVSQQVMMEMQQQAMMAAAAAGGGGPQRPDGPGGSPSTISSDTGGPTPVQPNEAIDESMMGGMQ